MNVVELEVPKGQHIKDVLLKSGWYIDQIGFRTNENIQLGPVGGDGGSYRKLAPNGKNSIKQTYLHSISGKTFEAQNAPCIAAMNFTFAEVPNVHWKEDARQMFKSKYHANLDNIMWDSSGSDDE